MKSFGLIILTLFFNISVLTETIIIRHDVSDKKYIKFAKELPVTATLVKYNGTSPVFYTEKFHMGLKPRSVQKDITVQFCSNY